MLTTDPLVLPFRAVGLDDVAGCGIDSLSLDPDVAATVRARVAHDEAEAGALAGSR